MLIKYMQPHARRVLISPLGFPTITRRSRGTKNSGLCTDYSIEWCSISSSVLSCLKPSFKRPLLQFRGCMPQNPHTFRHWFPTCDCESGKCCGACKILRIAVRLEYCLAHDWKVNEAPTKQCYLFDSCSLLKSARRLLVLSVTHS